MASQRTKFAVGLFISSGLGIAILAIIWLGMSHYLEKGQYYVVYFDESVQGLNKDSPVKYRGVQIGRVDSIGVAPDFKLIEVILKIEYHRPLPEDIVAQLKSIGITGIMFVELDRMKEDESYRSPPVRVSEHPIVPSKPSDIKELLAGIDDVLKRIKSVDLKGISDSVIGTLDRIEQKVSDADVKGISENIESSLESAGRILDDKRWERIMASVEEAGKTLNTVMKKTNRSLNRVEKTLARVEGIITDKEMAIKTAIEDFRMAMENANIFLEKGTSLISGTDDSLSHLKQHLLVVVQNMEMASENLNRLSELLADQPSQLIFGEPLTPRNMEPEVYER